MRLVAIAALLVSGATASVHAREPPPEPVAGEPVSELRQLTSDTGVDAMPSWTADGLRIVFHARRPPEKKKLLPTRKIWIVDRDGENARKLSDGAADEYHPISSPDGTRIAFVSEGNGSRDVWVMDAEGKNPLPLTDDAGLEEHPCWSPDGRRIAYVALPRDGGNLDLWVMNNDGSGKKKLTFTAANEVFPVWHPDGRSIVFATDMNGNFDLYEIALADEKLGPLVTGADNDTRPAFSPDGTKIAFTRWPAEGRSSDATLWVANSDGSVPTELAIEPPAAHPVWSPDGRTLAFQRLVGGNWNLWTARLPDAVVREGRLRLARQLRGRTGEDVVRLRSAGSLRGKITVGRFRLRAPYALVELPQRVLASIRFADLEKGTATVVLVNGDTLSGLPLDDHVEIVTAAGKQTIRRERIETVGFRSDAAGASIRSGAARLAMRNGDAFGAALRSRSVVLRVGSQTMELPFADIARVDFGEEGKKTQVVTRKGDSLSGALETTTLDVEIADGVSLSLYPSTIRTLTLTEAPR